MLADAPSVQSFRIAALYCFFAACWILFSDQVVGWYFSDPAAMTRVAMLKGWFFVLVTAAMLFVLVRRQLRLMGETSDARVRAEEAVRKSEERFRSLTTLSPDIISIFDREGRLTFNSDAAHKVHGYREQDLVGRPTTELIHPDDREAVGAAFAETLSQPGRQVVVRYRFRNLDGSYTWMEASARNELSNPHLQGIICISRDISERVRTEKALREKDERFQKLVSSISDTLFAADLNCNITYISPQVHQFGYTQEEAIGRNLLEFVIPEERARVAGEYQKAMVDGILVGSEFRVRNKDGSTAWVQESSGFILSEAGERVGVSGMLRNITDRKRAEEERRSMQDQLFQAQRMEAIGRLAGGVAHDLNNILTILSMNIETLKQESLPEQVHSVCVELEEATGRASSLTRQLLLFARRQVVQKRVLEVDALLARLLSMLRRLIGENITVETRNAPHPKWVHADAGMIEQVIMNLVVNARDAMPQGGRLGIATQICRLEGDSAASPAHPRRRAGTFIGISVSDTGCGMDGKTLQRLFEPFFTTKEAGKGTGLGLATAFGIVQQHEGWIEVESLLGHGSTFTVYLPETKPAKDELPASQAALQGGNESILVAEDDPGIRHLCVDSLQHLGYRVSVACHGKQALEIWTQHQGAFDLLLTDMIMPEGLTGLDLAQLLRREKPSLKVLLMSGYSLELSQHDNLENSQIIYLAKPFNPPALTQAVRRALD